MNAVHMFDWVLRYKKRTVNTLYVPIIYHPGYPQEMPDPQLHSKVRTAAHTENCSMTLLSISTFYIGFEYK